MKELDLFNMGISLGKPNIKDKASVFVLGDRIHVLTDPEPGIIIPQAAEDKNIVRSFFCLMIRKKRRRLIFEYENGRNIPLKRHSSRFAAFSWTMPLPSFSSLWSFLLHTETRK
jgi:hypothetical protein